MFNTWADEGLEEPVIEEQFKPDRTVLTLSFKKKVAKKSGEKKWRKDGEKVTKKRQKEVRKVTKKTMGNYNAILSHMEPNIWYRASEFETVVDVKISRIKLLLAELEEQGLIESSGRTKGKMYRKIAD